MYSDQDENSDDLNDDDLMNCPGYVPGTEDEEDEPLKPDKQRIIMQPLKYDIVEAQLRILSCCRDWGISEEDEIKYPLVQNTYEKKFGIPLNKSEVNELFGPGKATKALSEGLEDIMHIIEVKDNNDHVIKLRLKKDAAQRIATMEEQYHADGGEPIPALTEKQRHEVLNPPDWRSLFRGRQRMVSNVYSKFPRRRYPPIIDPTFSSTCSVKNSWRAPEDANLKNQQEEQKMPEPVQHNELDFSTMTREEIYVAAKDLLDSEKERQQLIMKKEFEAKMKAMNDAYNERTSLSTIYRWNEELYEEDKDRIETFMKYEKERHERILENEYWKRMNILNKAYHG